MHRISKKNTQKVLSIVSAAFAASVFSMILPTAAPLAFATAAITVTSPSIENGQAQRVTFGSGSYTIPTAASGGTQEVLCLFVNGTYTYREGNVTAYGPGESVPAFIEVSDGTLDQHFNQNTSASTKTFQWAWIDVVKLGGFSPQCNSLPQEISEIPNWSGDAFYGSATITQSVTWTVNPALDSPLAQTIYLNENNTTPVTLSGNYYQEVANIAGDTSKWIQRDLSDCDPTAPSDRVDLSSLGLTLDETVSPAGQIAPLLISGTPTSNSVGTHALCLRLDAFRDLMTIVNLTIAAERPAPVLPVTGVSSGQSGSVFAVGALAVGLGILGLVLVRQSRKHQM